MSYSALRDLMVVAVLLGSIWEIPFYMFHPSTIGLNAFTDDQTEKTRIFCGVNLHLSACQRS